MSSVRSIRTPVFMCHSSTAGEGRNWQHTVRFLVVGISRQCVPCRSQGLTLRQGICTEARVTYTRKNLDIFTQYNGFPS
jgi:hypothetical protein